MERLAKAALDAVRNGEVKIRPESAEKDFFRWLENINDWCLSRQLWWGHQIAAYYVAIDGEPDNDSDGERWVTGRTLQEAEEKAQKKFSGVKYALKRDEDVLDTWFSAGLWPISTLDWPNTGDDFKMLYPQSLLETGWDILFFWVARMIMLGIKFTGKVPFTEVFCHPLIRDSEGRKMSKSLGNVIDPMDIMSGIPLQALHDKLLAGNLDQKEVANATKYQKTAFPQGLPECGADALRFSLVNYIAPNGEDINFDINVMHGFRKFCNKIYQATKYVLGNLDESFKPAVKAAVSRRESLAEKWILHNMTMAAERINQSITNREFQKATQTAYQFWYSQLCDVFIENSKFIISEGSADEQESAKQTLYTALETALRMIHPFMPFLSEELWQRLPRRPEDKTPSICVARFPTYDKNLDDPASQRAYELILDVTQGIRSLMSQYALKENGKLYVRLTSDTAYSTCKGEMISIHSLSGKRIESINLLSSNDAKPSGCVPAAINEEATVFLLLKGQVDIDGEIEKARKKLEGANKIVEKQQKILNNDVFATKVGQELQEVERKRLRDAEKEVEELQGSIEGFEMMKLEE